ncbi:hypothetical protein F5Y11DRAFT_367639 [Daldinia sp. FL1419]|nr:hypothetical protein F5Y11DRAFT_367639 [Daldinia sp. FL1419]
MDINDWPLANCPPRGTPIRGCPLPCEFPSLSAIKSGLNEMCILEWSYAKARPQGPVIHNLYIHHADSFICAFELSRQSDDFENFKRACLRPEIASLPDEEILARVARIAQDRARLINYLLSTRVSPVYHQEFIDQTNPPNTAYEKVELKLDRPRMALKVVEAFWGFECSGDPLPTHRGLYTGISNYDGWGDPIDDKLTIMAEKLGKDPEKAKDLF